MFRIFYFKLKMINVAKCLSFFEFFLKMKDLEMKNQKIENFLSMMKSLKFEKSKKLESSFFYEISKDKTLRILSKILHKLKNLGQTDNIEPLC